MTFDWNLAKTFLAVSDEGSLSAAARVLSQTQPTVSRQIAALEEALGVTLFERTGRSVELTHSGIELLDHVRAMAIGANMVSLTACGQSQSIEGQVRITASELMSAYILPAVLQDISNQAPSLEINVIADNGVRDLVRREADIAIRHVRPDQPNLLMRRVCDQTMRFYASPDYLRKRRQPTKTNVSIHQIISFVDEDRMLDYLRPIGLDLTKANFRFSSSSQLVALEMARRGLGMIIAPDWIAQGLTDFVHVLDEVEPFKIPTWLVTHSEMRTSRRIRLVFDHLVDRLS
ncbi:MAG: LysR family transcriptional regulator [Sulfitobacter sp.]